MAESLGGLMMTKLDPASAGGSRGAPWCERSARKQDEGSKHYSKSPKRCIRGAVLATRTEKIYKKWLCRGMGVFIASSKFVSTLARPHDG
jgi:hypothetical protein